MSEQDIPEQEWGEPLESQVDRLAKFILKEIPGEPSQNQGAIDTAIRLLKESRASGWVAVGERLPEGLGDKKLLVTDGCRHSVTPGLDSELTAIYPVIFCRIS